MSEAVVEVGDKFHIMTRRLFEADIRRHFAGEVTAVSGSLVELDGYTFVFNTSINEYRKLPEVRTRLFSPGDSGHIVNKLPRDLDLNSMAYRIVEHCLVVTDGRSFSLAINEFGPKS